MTKKCHCRFLLPHIKFVEAIGIKLGYFFVSQYHQISSRKTDISVKFITGTNTTTFVVWWPSNIYNLWRFCCVTFRLIVKFYYDTNIVSSSFFKLMKVNRSTTGNVVNSSGIYLALDSWVNNILYSHLLCYYILITPTTSVTYVCDS